MSSSLAVERGDGIGVTWRPWLARAVSKSKRCCHCLCHVQIIFRVPNWSEKGLKWLLQGIWAAPPHLPVPCGMPWSTPKRFIPLSRALHDRWIFRSIDFDGAHQWPSHVMSGCRPVTTWVPPFPDMRLNSGRALAADSKRAPRQ